MIPWNDEILQTGTGPVDGSVYLSCDPEQVLWGRLPCAADAPVLRIDPGTSVTVDTLSHEGILEDQGRDPRAWFGGHGVDPEQVLAEGIALAGSDRSHDPAVDGPHVVTGPIAVTGARPGDLLRMTLESTQLRVPYGVISNRHGKGALVGEYPAGPGNVSVFAAARRTADGDLGVLPLAAGSDREVTFPLRPFLGIMGVAVAEEQRPHSVPPGPHGGNIDINLLTAGSSLYLPVQVADALAYVGDPHFAQGDGEVSLTAMEASLRATVRFDVIPAEQAVAEFGELIGPLAETAEYLVPTGMDPDLDVAVQNCVRAAIALLQARFGMDAVHAYAYLSAATDFDISQVVDIVKGVHARIRVEDFRR
ncbi:acetamidase [Nakamurella sp. YIM 132087]|uniref:Acetamidase n=1 Tax=Nakamurella alba TaxID=2665158 RepID=A0A7K1FM33_9ACTN|nr:acetamidase/formamidase family protein [Nakamurella alba]MTD14303.1 acetamidase [Nakamurella alba]